MMNNFIPSITTDDIRKALDAVGVELHYMGYEMLVAALERACEDPQRLLRLRDEIYQPIALREGCNASMVERRIRIAIRGVWNYTPDKILRLFDSIAIHRAPTNSQFLSRMVRFIKENSKNNEH